MTGQELIEQVVPLVMPTVEKVASTAMLFVPGSFWEVCLWGEVVVHPSAGRPWAARERVETYRYAAEDRRTTKIQQAHAVSLNKLLKETRRQNGACLGRLTSS